MNEVYYCIDLDRKKREVLEYSGQTLDADLKFFNCKDALEMNSVNYDRRTFETPEEAEAFLQRYNDEIATLDNSKICKSRKLPAMLYKRRYLILSLLGEKLQTVRSYKKNWNTGDLINLHDQNFFLTVQLTVIEEFEHENKKFYRYKFQLPS